jgi:hypothetical protein
MAYRRKRKFFGNQYTLPKKQKAEEVEPSRSERKLSDAT